MNYFDLSKEELIEEIRKKNLELEENHNIIQAIRTGQIDAVIITKDSGEQVFVLDDANITYRRMIEEMNEGAVTFTLDGSVLFCNKAFAKLVESKVENIVSKPVTSFTDSKFTDIFRSISSDGNKDIIRSSIKLTSATGETIPVQISMHRMYMAGMEIVLMTVTDEREKLYIKKLTSGKIALEKLTVKLREAKEESEKAADLLKVKNEEYTKLNKEYIEINNKLTKTNQELLIAMKKAEKSDKLKSAFIANMSHEIRTPLNSILGYTKILMDRIADEDQKHYINVITRSGENLLNLINDIVDLSRLEASEMKIALTEVAIDDLMLNMKKQFEAYALNKNKHNIELNLILPENKSNLVIMTDEWRIKQILSNILSNAFKYTNRGSIEFGYEINNSKNLKFFVKDTGTGINKEDQEIIFNRFQQGSNTMKEVISGTGLGLAISKGLTRLLGGNIWVESKKDSGSAFYFTIPLTLSESSSAAEQEKDISVKTSGAPRLSGKKILVSEDDFYSREMLVYLLKKTNASIFVAKDGRETIKKFLQENFDLVLLDIRLPVMDGFKVIKKIRSVNSDTVVIAQTAYAMLEDIQKFNEAGFTDYVTKPINDTVLYDILHKYLG